MLNPSKYTLTTENLSIGYSHKSEKKIVAKDITISLIEGELVGLVGANGIGKSTLLRTLCKVQKPLSGKVFYDALDLNSISFASLATKLSVVLTEYPATKNLTVIELIALGRQPYTNWLGTLTKTDKEKVNEAIRATEIESLQHKKCYELSDGQLQRVMIARALAQDTPIILLDEPTTHLDIYHRVSILKLLKHLAATTNKTILFSTHEIDLAIPLCDKMVVMTKDDTYFDTPKALMKNDCFATLFPEDLIQLDKKTGSFKIIFSKNEE